MTKKINTSPYLILVFLAIYIVILLLSLSAGRYGVDPLTIVKILFSKILPIAETWTAQEESVIMNIRLPRILASSLIGAGLSSAGLVFQTIFRNPMVSPDVLGTSNAAGFGASLAMVLMLPSSLISPIAFIFGLASIGLVYLIASRVPKNHVLGLVLGGIMISSIFSSLLSFVKLIADPTDTLPSITYFLMGSLSGITMKDIGAMILPIGFSLIALVLISWRINLLGLSEDEARSLGVNTKALRAFAILASVIIISSSVSYAGVIGWIGLVIPHIVRMLIGCDARKTIPSSMVLGAAFLTLVDTISRTIAFSEIPIGILTSLIGAPFFLYLIAREGRRQNAED